MDTNRIVTEHQDLVYHVLNRMIKDRDRHDDVFQEVFLNVLRSLPRFRGTSKLSTWVYSVAVRTCLNHLKKAKRDVVVSLDQRQEADGWEPRANSGTGRDLAASEREQVLGEALDTLPLKYRLPLMLFYLEERSYREIAEILEIPLGTVKTNMFRGLRAMRRSLGGELDAYL